jgi:hypothetical protein
MVPIVFQNFGFGRYFSNKEMIFGPFLEKNLYFIWLHVLGADISLLN